METERGYMKSDRMRIDDLTNKETTIIRLDKELIWDIDHTWGDNGRFDVDLQLLDDDMYWDLTGPQPVYTGPAGQEDMWISHNIFPNICLKFGPAVRYMTKCCPPHTPYRGYSSWDEYFDFFLFKSIIG